MDSAAAASSHAPALKVGGRRLSLSARHKTTTSTDASRQETTASPEEGDDYPRPAPPNEEQPAEQQVEHPHIEDEIPLKKEKKHNQHENDKKLKETPHYKAETTRPTRDLQGGNKSYGGGGRIAQPASRSFGS